MNRAEALEAMIIEKAKVTHPSFADGNYVTYGGSEGFIVSRGGIGMGAFSVRRSMCSSGWTIVDYEKEQGSMKYKTGDVLENEYGSFTIEGNIGRVYFGITGNDEALTFTDHELRDHTLKTDEPAKTDMTVSEIETALGKPAGSLNVTAEK